MVELFLRFGGFAVCSAPDGVAALECVGQNRPCLILLDVNMPRMDGVTFARELRRHADPQLAGTPIVLLTAVMDARPALEATGAVDVISKPASFEQIVQSVERHCGA